MSDDYTQAQRQCLERCFEQLSEQFDHVLLVVETEVPSTKMGTESATETYLSGGVSNAIGMATRFIFKQCATVIERNPPE
jgi:hypothetical protein